MELRDSIYQQRRTLEQHYRSRLTPQEKGEEGEEGEEGGAGYAVVDRREDSSVHRQVGMETVTILGMSSL